MAVAAREKMVAVWMAGFVLLLARAGGVPVRSSLGRGALVVHLQDGLKGIAGEAILEFG